MEPRPLPFRPIHNARIARGDQPWVREQGRRRQYDEGPQHPISMLERAGTWGQGQPQLYTSRSGEVRISTTYWGSMTDRQRRRWNARTRSQLRNYATGEMPSSITEALNNHRSYIHHRREFCHRQAAQMQQRMDNPRPRRHSRRANAPAQDICEPVGHSGLSMERQQDIWCLDYLTSKCVA